MSGLISGVTVSETLSRIPGNSLDRPALVALITAGERGLIRGALRKAETARE
ncbi:MAG: hypothetical protein AB7O95_01930 [Geminicoccaceae bacterium]